jgi:hypothetical protein
MLLISVQVDLQKCKRLDSVRVRKNIFEEKKFVLYENQNESEHNKNKKWNFSEQME